MALKLRDAITLYLCRHGETEANVEKRFQGWTKDTALTARGREQALSIASILGRELDARPSIACVCSPLLRARVTMEIIRGALGLACGDYRTDDRLKEINLGAWDGLTDAEVRAQGPAAFDARQADKWNMRVPGGGENYSDVAARAEDWVASLKADTFAVSHGAFTRILRGLFDGLDWKAMSALDEPQGCVFRVRGGTVARLDP
jgi:broad specificity phosphatase PhoE